MKSYIAELEKGVWIADWEGDPGRTLKIENAKSFNSKKAAQLAVIKIKKDNPSRKFKHSLVMIKPTQP